MSRSLSICQERDLKPAPWECFGFPSAKLCFIVIERLIFIPQHYHCKLWSWSRYFLRRKWFVALWIFWKLCRGDKALVSTSQYPLINLLSSPRWKILAITPSSNLLKIKIGGAGEEFVIMLSILHVVNVSKNWSISERKKMLYFLTWRLKLKGVSMSVCIT